MSFFTKLIGGGLGWAFGGPLGAIVGYSLASMFEDSDTATIAENRKSGKSNENDFKVSLLVLMACVMKADGRIDKAELAVVKKFLVANFGEENALEALQMLKKILEQPINEAEVASQIGRNLNYSSKLELLHLLFNIAYADGEVSPPEMLMLQRISNHFGLSSLDFESIKAPYTKQIDRDWAYKSLEIEPSATNDEIKKAYRRMAMKYHPDKVTDLGEDIKKSATEKFRSINEAYESLKKERGMA